MLKSFVVSLALLLGLLPTQGIAEDAVMTPEIAMILKIFGPDPAQESDFSPEFLAQVPIASIRAITEATKAEIGVPEAVEKRAQDYLLFTASHEMAVQMNLNAQGKVQGLLIQPPVALQGTLEDAVALLAGLSPDLSYLVLKDGVRLAAANAEMRLAVGSTFKLAVLAVLKDRIEAGTLKWEDVVHLKASDKSFPSGILQTWPDGAPLTLHTLAALMISQSDNTATDMLIDVVGRDAVSARLGGFAYKTRELFILKGDPELADRFRATDLVGKGEMAAALAERPLPDIASASTPVSDGLEWYVSVAELCSLIGEVADLEVMQINPGVASPGDWAAIAFKGGSEVGVLNLTSALTAKNGSHYCVSVTWNAKAAIDEAKAIRVYGGLVGQLSRMLN